MKIKPKSIVAFALHDLITALNAAKEHLEYCGYGDSWERECALGARLPEQIESALREGKAVLYEGKTNRQSR